MRTSPRSKSSPAAHQTSDGTANPESASAAEIIKRKPKQRRKSAVLNIDPHEKKVEQQAGSPPAPKLPSAFADVMESHSSTSIFSPKLQKPSFTDMMATVKDACPMDGPSDDEAAPPPRSARKRMRHKTDERVADVEICSETDYAAKFRKLFEGLKQLLRLVFCPFD